MLVDVQTTEGVSLAKIIQENRDTYTVAYMSYQKKGIYNYEPPCEVEKECIAGFYNPEDDERSAGFQKVEGGYILLSENSDDDYEPSDCSSETESCSSLVTSDDENEE